MQWKHLAAAALAVLGSSATLAHHSHANYDVSPDGKTFVMVRRSPAARIVVIQNLPALVRRLQGERPRR